MKKLFLLIILNALALNSYSQLNGDFGIGFNYFTNDFNHYKRTHGYMLTFGLEKNLTDIFALRYGLNIGISNEIITSFSYDHYFDINSGTIVTDYSIINSSDTKGYSISLYYPLTLSTEIINDKLFVLTGISIDLNNIFNLINSNSALDPETNLSEKYSIHQPINSFGFGTQIGILYRPFKRIGIYCEWKSSNTNSISYSFIELGLSLRIIDNR